MNNFLFTLVLKYSTPIASFFAGLIVSGLVWLCSTLFGLEIPEDQRVAVLMGITGFIAWLITAAAGVLMKKNAEIVQETINDVQSAQIPTLKEDGLIQNRTLNALKGMVDLLNKQKQ